MGVIMGLGAMVFWGVAIFLAAIANRKFENVVVLFWMQLFGLLLGIIYFLFNLGTVNFGQVVPFIPQLIAIALLQMWAYLAFYAGLKKGQVTLVSSIGASWGLLAAILGMIFLKETMKVNQVIAIFLIISGIVLASTNIKEIIENKKIKLLMGVKEGLMAMVGWGVSLFLLATLTKVLGWFLPALIFRLMLLVFLSVYIGFAKKDFVPAKVKFPVWLLLAIGVFDMLAFFAFSIGTSGSSASIVAPIGSAYTLITIALAKIFLKEKIKTNQAIGICGIIAGLVLISI
jgi:drug/metabolite transporter (DMT)-like permease